MTTLTSTVPALPALPTTTLPPVDALQARFGRRIAACLTERSTVLEPDLTERLRFAREKALERARAARRVEAVGVVGVGRHGVALLGGRFGWGLKFASVMPVLVLAIGLFLIQHAEENAQIDTAAAVDAALLADTLPPQAYSDAGFAEFLKTAE